MYINKVTVTETLHSDVLPVVESIHHSVSERFPAFFRKSLRKWRGLIKAPDVEPGSCHQLPISNFLLLPLRMGYLQTNMVSSLNRCHWQ